MQEKANFYTGKKQTLAKILHHHLHSSDTYLLLKFISNFVSDVDECMNRVNGVSSKGGCQHKCNNTIGLFICSCNKEFVLRRHAKVRSIFKTFYKTSRKVT